MSTIQHLSIASECVSEGHPDKVADQISDAILDHYLQRYNTDSERKHVKCAVETLVASPNTIVIAGEISLPKGDDPTTAAEQEARRYVVRRTLATIGYTTDLLPVKQRQMSAEQALIIDHIAKQSGEINKIVGDTQADDQDCGADQGMMYGFATHAWFAPEDIFQSWVVEEYPAFNHMPPQLVVCRVLMQQLSRYRKANPDCGLLPDAKAFAVLRQGDVNMPIERIAISVWNRLEESDGSCNARLVERVHEAILAPVFNAEFLAKLDEANSKDAENSDKVNLQINAAGPFTHGGPQADSGLTGRKIIVDTYGGAAPHGGGAFSGKDATKVDRSAAYYARCLARQELLRRTRRHRRHGATQLCHRRGEAQVALCRPQLPRCPHAIQDHSPRVAIGSGYHR